MNIGRRPMRSGLTILGLCFAVAGFIALIGLTRGLENAWVSSLLDRGTHLIAMKKGAVEILTASIDEKTGNKLRRIDGVEAVSGELTDLVSLSSGKTALVTGWEEDGFLWDTLYFIEGRAPAAKEGDEVAVGQGLAEALEIHTGQPLEIGGMTFTVAGIFRQNSIMANGTVILPLEKMQHMMNRENSVTVFNIRIEHPDNERFRVDLLTHLGQTFGDVAFTETRDIAKNNEIMDLFRAMAWGISSIALVIALVFIVNTLLMSVTERTREIGILSALGWSRARILAMIVFEGLLLSVLGALAGTACGIGGLYYLANLEPLRGFLQPEVSFRLLAEVCGATLMLGMLGGIYPALRALKINPIVALRYE